MAVPIILSEEAIVLLLLATAIIASIVLAKIRFPYTVGLVVIGYVFAAYVAPNIPLLSPLSGFTLSSDVILFLFLPPLIFESAITLNSRLLSINILPILLLAVIGLVISAVVVGVLLTFVSPLPLIFALLFGAFISATDPVAVIALFRELGVPKKLRALVEGESLFNDASAIVTFNLIMGVIVVQSAIKNPSILFIPGQFATDLLVSFAGGITVGSLMALAVYAAIRASPNHPHIHQTVSVVVAYAAFILSQVLFNFSGVIAVVAAGIVVSRLTSEKLGLGHRRELARFWEYIGFLADTLIFLLVGLSITSLEDPTLFTSGFIIATVLVIIAVLIARAVSVFGLIPLVNIVHKDRKIPLSYQTVIFWGGLRGAVALALVLSLPPTMPFRDLLVGFTIAVVIFTILVSGTTISTLVRKLHLSRPDSVRQFEKLWLGIQLKNKSIRSLEDAQSRKEQILPEGSVEAKISDLRAELSSLRQEFSLFWDTVQNGPEVNDVQVFLWIAAIDYEKQEYIRMYDSGLIPAEVLDQVLYNADVRYDYLQVSGKLPKKPVFFSPFFRLIRRLYSLLLLFPGLGTSRAIHEKNELRSKIFRAYTLFSVAREMKDWILDLAEDTGADRSVLEFIVREYEAMYTSARSDFSELARESPGMLQEIFSYMADRVTISGQKALLSSLGEEGFLEEQAIENALNAVERDENQVARKLRHV
jgi:CPA1 family monovalent cation:H+ antiporter